MLSENGISLGVPIERRVKKWGSIAEKLERKSLSLKSCADLPDLIGLRIILLYKRDVDRTCELLRQNFRVIQEQDKGAELEVSHFGYGSMHYVVKAPEAWAAVPTLAKTSNLQAEIQVRTLAQHIWAAASHTLQYKREDSIPPAVRRSINRVAALLETVDLEFERVLLERAAYLETTVASTSVEELNVDLLRAIANELLPLQNKEEDENFEVALQDLKAFGINSARELRLLLEARLSLVLKQDAELAEKYKTSSMYSGPMLERMKKGFFFTHVGLIRRSLKAAFGKQFVNYMQKQRRRIVAPPSSP